MSPSQEKCDYERRKNKMSIIYKRTPRKYLPNKMTKMTYFNLSANEVGYALAFNYSSQIRLL